MIKQSKNRRGILLRVALVAAMLAAVLAGGRYYHTGLLVEHCAHRLAAAPDEQVADCLAQAAQLGDPGLELLVRALGSPRSSVATAARRTLFEELARYELLPSDEAGRRSARIAELLAREAPGFDAAGRRAAATLAARLVSWPRQDMVAHRTQLVAHCERVLRAALPERAALAARSVPLNSEVAGSEPQARRLQPLGLGDQPRGVDRAMHVAALPGGALPVDLHATETKSQVNQVIDATETASPSAVTAPPRLLDVDVNNARPLAAVAADETPSVEPHNPLRAGGVPNGPMAIAVDRPATRSEVLSESPPEVRVLIEQLNSLEAATAERAGAELLRRGFSPLELDLGKRLTDRDPAVRRRWIEALPGLRGIDAKPWLLWLSRDLEADVRLASLTLMATSGESEMLGRVGEMAREDVDPSVRAQAARAIDGRGRRR